MVSIHGLAYESHLNVGNEPALLLIDAQNDFHPGGSLAISTADEDAVRIAKLIREHGSKFSAIYATLDTHQQYHIAHPQFWKNEKGEHPAPFTSISHQNVVDKVWVPYVETKYAWGLEYTKQLALGGKFNLTIWPPHCLVGTPGHGIKVTILDALHEWEATHHKSVHFINKGNNSMTEHYSAIKSEVIVPGREVETGLNHGLVKQLNSHNKVYVCGQALSHCVNFTVRDLADNWETHRFDDIIILKDASSSVPGFEKEGDQFLKDMQLKGLSISTTLEI